MTYKYLKLNNNNSCQNKINSQIQVPKEFLKNGL